MISPLAYNRDYALNAICPYFTMFPLEYPVRIIRRHKSGSPVVVDPFCGRGTTIYAARRAGLRSYGFDVSPIAVAIARAKLSSASAQAIVKLARKYFRDRAEAYPRSIILPPGLLAPNPEGALQPTGRPPEGSGRDG